MHHDELAHASRWVSTTILTCLPDDAMDHWLLWQCEGTMVGESGTEEGSNDNELFPVIHE